MPMVSAIAMLLLVIVGSDACPSEMNVTGSSGTIESPGYPDLYPNNVKCLWNIHVDQNMRISLKFNRTFDVEGIQGQLCYDFVQIIEGNTSLKYCGPTPALSYLSRGRTLSLLFATDPFVVGSGFSVQWQAINESNIPPPVMIDVNSTTGVITSPNYPQNYTNFLNYSWKIRKEGKFFAFEINSNFSMEGSTAILCPYDRLVFSTVNLTKAVPVCGTNPPEIVQITASEVLVSFTTDMSNVFSGFSFNYRPLDIITCDEPFRINGTFGVITSPYYPSEYLDNHHCTWHIEAPELTLIAVRFNNPFNIYKPSESDCSVDYLQIFDGPSTASPKYTAEDFCGLYHPRGFLSTGNTLTIVFHSEDKMHGEGFSFNWTTEAACRTDEFRCWNNECISKSLQCNGNVDCSEDIADEAECSTNETSATSCGTQAISPVFKWDLRIIGGSEAVQGSWPWQAILFYITDRGIRITCGGVLIADTLVLTAAHCILAEEKRAGSQLVVGLGNYNLAVQDILREQNIFVNQTFVHPDYDYRSQFGFLFGNDIAVLQLSSPIRRTVWVQPICLPTANLEPVTNTHAIITGWGATFPIRRNHYPDVLRQVRVRVIDFEACRKEFFLNSPVDLSSKIICVGLFDTGGANSCFGDSGGPVIQLLDGKWVVIALVSFGYQCGTVPKRQAGHTKVSSFIPYVQSFLNGSAYHVDRGIEIITNADNGTLSSPNSGSWYEPLTSRTWYITTSPRTRMLVRFSSIFNIEFSDGCVFDSLLIYDGLNTQAPKYLNKKLCGTIAPADFISAENGIIVKFETDSSFQEVGFSFRWTTIFRCNSDQYSCSDGSCIPFSQMCDQITQCPDNDDEIQCVLAVPGMDECGKQEIAPFLEWTPLIVNGDDATEGSWPWHASIFRNGIFDCGGTLLGDKWVVTSAQCLRGGQYVVKLGDHSLKETSERQRDLNVTSSVAHPSYNLFSNDIALLELEEAVLPTRWIKPICLPQSDAPILQPGTTCIVTGHGMIHQFPPSRDSDVLQQLQIKILPDAECIEYYRSLVPSYTDEILPNSIICAGNTNRISNVCGKDTGSALQCLVKGRWEIHGITSLGSNVRLPCGDVAFFTRVSSYLSWIDEETYLPPPPTKDCVRTCIATDASSSREDKMSRWVCELVNWRCGMSGWMSTFITWWDGCIESDNVELWQGRFTCPSNNTFQCCSGEQMCFRDAFRCNICHCVKGTYKYASRLINIWDKDQEIYQERVDFYNRYKDSCTQRDLEDECPA